MRAVIGLGLLLLACGGKSASEGDARGGAESGAGASSVAGSAGALGGQAGGASEAGSAGAIDENDPAGALVLVRQVDWLIGDDERLYWLAEPDVFQSCTKADCANTVVDYPPNVTIPWVGDSKIFWSDERIERVLACPKAGCDGAPSVVATYGSESLSLLGGADGEYAYWIDGKNILRCAATGFVGAGELVAVTDPAASRPLVFRGDDLFWTSASGIWKTAKDGSGKPTQIVPVPIVDSSTSAVGPNAVYWVDEATHHVLSCPLDGCGSLAPTTIASTASAKKRLQADDSGVYWGEDQDGELHYCPRAGCSESTVVTEGGFFGRYTVDARYVYWVRRGVGDGTIADQIVRRLKPAR